MSELPAMSEAQFIILSTKLDGIKLLLDEKLTNLEEKVDQDRRTREQVNERTDQKIDAHDARITALEHDRTRNGAMLTVWIAGAAFVGGVMVWLIENHDKLWKVLGSLSG